MLTFVSASDRVERGAFRIFQRVRFPGSPSEPYVGLSHRIRPSRGLVRLCFHVDALAHGEGIAAPGNGSL
jgi:hypothetical protein